MEEQTRQDIIDSYKYKLMKSLLDNFSSEYRDSTQITINGIIDFIKNNGFNFEKMRCNLESEVENDKDIKTNKTI